MGVIRGDTWSLDPKPKKPSSLMLSPGMSEVEGWAERRRCPANICSCGGDTSFRGIWDRGV